MIWRKSKAGRYFAFDSRDRLWECSRLDTWWILTRSGVVVARTRTLREAKVRAEHEAP